MTTSSESPPNIRVLKAIVIGLGVLMVLGLAVLLVGFARQAMKLGKPDLTAASTETASGFGERNLALPRGARLVEVSQTDRRLVLRIRLATGVERLILIDAANGEKLGSLDIATTE
jgi:hypothetical protein